MQVVYRCTFWGDAVEYAAYVVNRSSCSANTKRMSPIEMLTGTAPTLSDIVTFGSTCSVFRNPGKRAWKTRSQVGMMLGKNDETKGFRVYLPQERIFITTQHVQTLRRFTVIRMRSYRRSWSMQILVYDALY